jgi:dGTPase
LKVAQVGRRLAQYLKLKTDHDLIKKCGGLNHNVVEAACLAHDLGHPPFGHIAEEELDRIATEAGLADGFEGNAQTFRILTKLEPYSPDYVGLNLTRATLDATLKYPWLRERDSGNIKTRKRSRKFSVYDLDRKAFKFVRPQTEQEESGQQSLEASIMDFADDVTYSVHDLEDFYSAGLIPLNILVQNSDEWETFIDEWIKTLPGEDPIKLMVEKVEEQKKLKGFLSSCLPPQYTPRSIEQINYLRGNSSLLIQNYVQSVSITDKYGDHGYLERQLDKEVELKLLQRIVWKYVILNPRLATQQYGQRKIIRELFSIYLDAIESNKINLIPSRFIKNNSFQVFFNDDEEESKQKIRLAIDIVASFSESEAVLLYRRLTGLEQGSVMDYIK